MPFPTNAASTELDAVNQILSSVGQAPVTTLDLRNPEVSITVNTLREVSKQVQLEGWTFNTEREYPMVRDLATNEITLPANVLSIDANLQEHKNDYDLVMRNGKLYDRLNKTYVFTEDPKVDVVWYFDFQFLPPAVQSYITARAARMCATKMVGDPQLYQLLTNAEEVARGTLTEYECNQGDYTIFGTRDGQDYYTGYQPYRALSRQ